ncbi:GNAT family N-acetyltransferase [Flammeovirgaceae bacterium SG7u.111]|nr:GNAT family N-acetyltransferase [Flammeovirgaceae bacterium SG7u.132]WPO33320.1 GNAT family N-acetyltransferase [Flammeovirgaceae bacterium SG7u.111]
MIKITRTNSENKDFAALVKQLDAALAETDGDDHAFYNQFNKTDKINHVLVAYKNDEALGCGAIRKYDATTMEIKRMYTSPESRGMGIASQILHELEKWSAELGFQKCILETGINQHEAIDLYKKNNYQLIPNYGPYAGIDTSFCFEKVL